MKVAGNNGINALKAYNENKLKASKDMNRDEKKYDSVEISKEGMEIARYAATVKNIPDIRYEKVEDIKRRIQNGSYKVSSQDLAKKILDAINEEK